MSDQMRAAVIAEHGQPLEIEQRPRPEATADQIVVETEACGVCRSDWHAWQGDWEWIGANAPEGQILGHEPAGKVVEVGEDVKRFSEGDRVAIPFTLGEGNCPYCRNGRGHLCDTITPLGFTSVSPGAFAEEFPVRAADHNAVALPDGVDPVSMAALGCRYTTAYHALAHRAELEASDWIAIHGCGGVGLSAVQIANSFGAGVIAVDVREGPLEQARSLGADETFNAAELDNVGSHVKAAADGGADVAVDALGIQQTCTNSIESLGKEGTHLQIGLTTSEEGGELSVPSDAMVMQEIEMVTSFGMPPSRYDEVLQMVERGRLDPGAIVSEKISLDELPDTLAAMGEYETTGIPVVTDFK
jgi:D-arabinose 1-dehydrogenase-like Zn-dependent alcohol dehydrogenase